MLGRLIHRGLSPVGLDIGASGARLLQLRRRGRQIDAVAAARIDRRAQDVDEDPLTDRMVEAVKRRVDAGEFASRDCVMTFPDHWLAARSVRLPVMPRDEMDAALRLEAAERLGFSDESPGQVAWVSAGRVRQGDEVREEIILLGVDRVAVEALVDRVAATGLRPIAVEPSVLAMARAYSLRHRRESDRDVVRVCLDIGRRNTGVIILRGRDVAFYKPLRVSGDDFTRAVAERLDIAFDSAVDLRAQRLAATYAGAAPCEPSVDRAVFEAVRPLIEELARETALCLRYFTVAFTGLRPSLVITSGSEAREPRLAETLGDVLRIEHQVGAPFIGIEVDAKARLGAPASGFADWAGALGLALRGLPEERRLKETEDDDAPAHPETRKEAA